MTKYLETKTNSIEEAVSSVVKGEGFASDAQRRAAFAQGYKAKGKKDKKEEDVDLFDLVKGQLLDEGIDEKDALKIMVELSQEDLKKIIDEGKLANIARLTAAGAVATMGADAINKQLQNQEKMKQGGKFKKGGIMDTIQKKNQMIQGM